MHELAFTLLFNKTKENIVITNFIIIQSYYGSSIMVRVTIFGHSFARRMKNDPKGRECVHPGLEYVFIAQGGLRWEHVARQPVFWATEIAKSNPHFLVIILGTNDLVYADWTPEFCEAALHNFVFTLRRVIQQPLPILLVPCTRRTDDCKPRRNQLSNEEFNMRARKYNDLCLELEAKMWSVHNIVWSYKNRWNKFCRDGLHLSPIGQADLFYTIQRAIMKLLPGERPVPPKPQLRGGIHPCYSN